MPTLLFLLACRTIPDAPKDLDLLGSYLFEHFSQEDPLYMEQGTGNLQDWIASNREAVSEGYRIENLSREAILDLGMSEDISLEGLVGAAVATDIHHSIETLIPVLLTTDPMELSPGSYGYFERTWNGDLDCFVQQECTHVEYEANLQNILPLGIEVESSIKGQYQWIYIDERPFVAQRRWMTSSGTSNQDWLVIDQDYALSIFLPTDNGMRFVDMEWVVTYLGDMPIPENFALSLAIKAMQDGRKKAETFIDEQRNE
ncbi:MAG: hypothetical protein VX278_08340 [Myxococcota bacterium]|nr:hypothetical protein [Myxococcota bacterium]